MPQNYGLENKGIFDKFVDALSGTNPDLSVRLTGIQEIEDDSLVVDEQAVEGVVTAATEDFLHRPIFSA